MNYSLLLCPPILILTFLIAFAGWLLRLQAKSEKDRGGETKEHSERIYKDFEMYLKVTLGLAAAFGFLRVGTLGEGVTAASVNVGLQLVGGVSLLVMTTFCIFIICHLGSKVRRWKDIEWEKAIFWQELWACLSMWVFSTGIWIAAHAWPR